MQLSPVARPWMTRSREALRTYVWNRKALGAVVVASPAIAAAVSSLVIGMVIDDRLSVLTRQRDAIALEMTQLDGITKEFESKELLRMSFLVALTSASAGDPLKYALDKLYRNDAAGSLRRIAAAVYPANWKEHVVDYEALVRSDYHDVATVQKLTDIENALVQDALQRITARQGESNQLANRIERLESQKSKLQSVLNGFMYVLTIVVFFVKSAD